MNFEKQEIYDEEIFSPDFPEQTTAVVWWLVYLLGGQVSFPLDERFWIEEFPSNTRLTSRVSDGKVHLIAEYVD